MVEPVETTLQYDDSQLQKVKDGSENADLDQYQKIPYNHMHAMRQPGETVAQAITRMRDYFIAQVIDFKSTGNHFYLGMAIHPIMDAYSSPHSGFKLSDAGRDGAISRHFPELLYLPNSIDVVNAEHAIYGVYSQLAQYPNGANNTQIGAIFDNWLVGYLKYLRYQ